MITLSVVGGFIVAAYGFQASTVGYAQAVEGIERRSAEGLEDRATHAEHTFKAGVLRIGNRTPYPLRVVLHRRSGDSASEIPAHWDFAPGEGGRAGLIVSLQEREPLVVHPGDVIVAFAIDGSRRYWGPNVVSETVAPFWNESDRSWTMILQP